VVLAELTGQSTPSITTLTSDVTALKPVPVKVTTVPPVTVPNLGLMLVNSGVVPPAYST